MDSTSGSTTSAEAKALVNLASSTNGASILFATDEWFATADRLLDPTPPAFDPDAYCEQGKVMDGWETRRKRSAGHDWCIVALGDGNGSRNGICNGSNRAYTISYIELDTAYFTGNQAPRVSIEAMKVLKSNDDESSDDDQDYLYKWMPGAITRLARGVGGKGVRGTGQSPSAVQRALEACRTVALQTIPDKPSGEWMTVLPMTPLKPGYEESRYHTFEISRKVQTQIENISGVTHLKLNYYPDGGVARMKVFGTTIEEKPKVVVDDGTEHTTAMDRTQQPIVHPHSSSNPPPSTLPHYPYPELSSERYGGAGLACSNKHYGVPSNLLRPSLGKDMGDGWETARHPDRPAVVTKDPATGLQDTPLMDWAVIKLGLGGAEAKVGEGTTGGVARIIVDTRHFKGNFPESVTIDACFVDPDRVSDEDVCASAGKHDDKGDINNNSRVVWFPLLKRTSLTADAEHVFVQEHGHIAGNKQRGVTHARISITPDGGLSRVRIYGSPAAKGGKEVIRSHL